MTISAQRAAQKEKKMNIYTVYGYRYMADGWSAQPRALFQFRAARELSTGEAMMVAHHIRRAGVDGAATLGMEDPTTVRPERRNSALDLR